MLPKLKLTEGDPTQPEFEISKEELLIGRVPPADVLIPGSGVSGRHARLIRRGHELVIEDLGSSNGIAVNGNKMPRSKVSPGDLVTMGVVEFRLAQGGDSTAILQFNPLEQSAARAATERIHDLTTTIETDIPETATRLWAVYRLNSGYAEADGLDATPGLGGRFDVQVNQRLPFVPLGDAEWELLIAVRSLFRTSLDGASLYDELLVVRPPKRIVGGLMIRF